MKYPNKLTIEFPKRLKSKKGQKARHFDFITKNFNLNNIIISRVPNDPRSNINYKVISIDDYDESLDFKLIRQD